MGMSLDADDIQVVLEADKNYPGSKKILNGS